MSKRILLTLILFFLITTIKSEDEEATMDEGEEMDDYVYDNYDGEQYFKEIVKEYLERNNLWQNDKLIQPDELKKIFLDIIADGEEDSEPRFKEAFDKLVDFFIDKYYKEKKEIRGKDVYDLIGITEISLKFDEILGLRSEDDEDEDDDDDDDDNDDDNMDMVGEPNIDF